MSRPGGLGRGLGSLIPSEVSDDRDATFQQVLVSEEAAAYQQLVDEFSMTQEQVAKRVGKSRSAVANTLRLLALPTSIQRLVSENRLSAGHARAVLSIEDADQQVAIAEQIVADELTVRQAEELVKSLTVSDVDDEDDDAAAGDSSPATSSIGSTRDPAVLELEELLSERLSTKVNVSLGSKRGKIVIDYADLDDLERIYHLINGD